MYQGKDHTYVGINDARINDAYINDARINDARILLLESPYSLVRWFVGDKICRIIDTCTIHICMLQDQGPGS